MEILTIERCKFHTGRKKTETKFIRIVEKSIDFASLIQNFQNHISNLKKFEFEIENSAIDIKKSEVSLEKSEISSENFEVVWKILNSTYKTYSLG